MLSLDQARSLAAWVNTHDDGTPMPRAHFISSDSAWVVVIKSTEVHPDGTSSIATDRAHSMAEARAILGY